MTKKLLIVPVAALLVAAGAAATARATLGGPAPAEAPPAAVEVPTALEDWCGFMAVAFGPAGGAPSVVAAVDASVAAGAATSELAYVAQLGGVPPEVEPQAGNLLGAVEELVAGATVADVPSVRAAAASVDTFLLDACGA